MMYAWIMLCLVMIRWILCIDDVCVDHAVFGDDKMDLCIDDVCVDHAVFGDDKRAAYKLQPPLLYCPTSAMLVSE